MAKEERAEKWFRNIPNAETIDLETRMEICSKVEQQGYVLMSLKLIVIAVFSLLANAKPSKS